ncbi:hypothetical protein RDWZM_004182, partial [Blomia tropicalis]
TTTRLDSSVDKDNENMRIPNTQIGNKRERMSKRISQNPTEPNDGSGATESETVPLKKTIYE